MISEKIEKAFSRLSRHAGVSKNTEFQWESRLRLLSLPLPSSALAPTSIFTL